jgi:hypothetical protein
LFHSHLFLWHLYTHLSPESNMAAEVTPGWDLESPQAQHLITFGEPIVFLCLSEFAALAKYASSNVCSGFIFWNITI